MGATTEDGSGLVFLRHKALMLFATFYDRFGGYGGYTEVFLTIKKEKVASTQNSLKKSLLGAKFTTEHLIV